MVHEAKHIRLPLMVTAAEVRAIDDWRYANRVPSRAETLRILIARGLRNDGAGRPDETPRQNASLVIATEAQPEGLMSTGPNSAGNVRANPQATPRRNHAELGGRVEIDRIWR